MLEGLILFGAMFFGRILICGVLGAALDKLLEVEAVSRWVDRLFKKMIKE